MWSPRIEVMTTSEQRHILDPNYLTFVNSYLLSYFRHWVLKKYIIKKKDSKYLPISYQYFLSTFCPKLEIKKKKDSENHVHC